MYEKYPKEQYPSVLIERTSGIVRFVPTGAVDRLVVTYGCPVADDTEPELVAMQRGRELERIIPDGKMTFAVPFVKRIDLDYSHKKDAPVIVWELADIPVPEVPIEETCGLDHVKALLEALKSQHRLTAGTVKARDAADAYLEFLSHDVEPLPEGQ